MKAPPLCHLNLIYLMRFPKDSLPLAMQIGLVEIRILVTLMKPERLKYPVNIPKPDDFVMERQLLLNMARMAVNPILSLMLLATR